MPLAFTQEDFLVVLNVHLLQYLFDEVKNRRLQAILLHRT